MAGVSGRYYCGEAGEQYLASKRACMEFSGLLTSHLLQPFVDETDTVVDFGCGTGALLERLTAARKIGVEINPVARSVAQARGLETVASARELETGTTDVIVSVHALEHTLSPYGELSELRRCLKSGGRLIMHLPIDDWRDCKSIERGRKPDPDHHLFTWTPRLMANLLSEVGFDVDACRVYPYAWPPRLYRSIYRLLPSRAFFLLSRCLAVVLRRRQLEVVATKAAGSRASTLNRRPSC